MEQKAYKIFITEDSDKDRELLEKSLASYNLFQVVGCLPGGSGALALIQSLHPDLLFIDVELPGLPGYEIVNKLHDVIMWDMKVVFYTAYPQYMLEAIRSAAFDFLLKPFEMKELDLIINRFVQAKIEKKGEVNIVNAMRGIEGESGKGTFSIQLPTGEIRVLRLSEIGYFKFNASRRCWEVFLFIQKLLAMRSSINAMNILGFSSQFVQIHKSYIINIQHLAMIDGDECIMYPPFNGERLPISSKYKKALQSSFIQL